MGRMQMNDNIIELIEERIYQSAEFYRDWVSEELEAYCKATCNGFKANGVDK